MGGRWVVQEGWLGTLWLVSVRQGIDMGGN